MSAADLPPGYPSEWEADVVMRDGTVAHLRPIRPSDEDGLQEFHSRQSEESIYLRFFAPLKQISERDLHRFTHVDYVDRVALVVLMRGDIIGIGRYDRISPRSAEVAFNISDHFQGKGIGSVLLEHLAAIARDMGITEFTAEVLPQNRKMLQVFSDAGYEVSRRLEDGVVAVHFDIEGEVRGGSARPRAPRRVPERAGPAGPQGRGRGGGQPSGVRDRQHVPRQPQGGRIRRPDPPGQPARRRGARAPRGRQALRHPRDRSRHSC